MKPPAQSAGSGTDPTHSTSTGSLPARAAKVNSWGKPPRWQGAAAAPGRAASIVFGGV